MIHDTVAFTPPGWSRPLWPKGGQNLSIGSGRGRNVLLLHESLCINFSLPSRDVRTLCFSPHGTKSNIAPRRKDVYSRMGEHQKTRWLRRGDHRATKHGHPFPSRRRHSACRRKRGSREYMEKPAEATTIRSSCDDHRRRIVRQVVLEEK
jgi:hypothetical protein